jgi:cytochrome-b5 reductase
MPGLHCDLSRVGLPLTALAGAVALVVYFLPRPARKFLSKVRRRVKVVAVHEISHDSKKIRLSLGDQNSILGLPTGKHICLYAPNPQECLDSGKWNNQDDPDRGKVEIERKYTPISGNDTKGYVDLVVKVYRPGTVKMPDGRETTWTSGGKMGLHLDRLRVGDSIDINGPSGVYEYLGKGEFRIPGGTSVTVSHVGMMAGGTGITPMLQVVEAALRDPADFTQWSLIYANKTQDDILVRDLLEDAEHRSNGRFKVHYTLDFPPDGWEHKKGFITEDMIKECLPPLSKRPLMLMCGPPPMVEHACKKNLLALGYQKSSMIVF